MKKAIVAGFALAVIAGSVSAFAGGYRGHGYYGGYHGYGYYGHKRHHRGHHHDDVAYLLGGIVLGSVITHAYQNRYPRTYGQVEYRRAYPVQREVVYRTRVIRPESSDTYPGRHLFRDLSGNCFEIRRNNQGDELREELPAEECSW